MMGGTISGSSRKARIASVKRLESRHSPIAASVPSTVDSTDEATAMTKLCPKLDSHSGLVNRFLKCCRETPFHGSER